MKELKSSFTTEKPIDYSGTYNYTDSKDAYDGNLTAEKNSTEKREDGPGGA